MDYHKTLNLPKTKFPMKAQLPRREPEMLKQWEEIGIYQAVREKRRGAQKYILHDGPPFANGAIHMGTALNKVLKDMIMKYKTMQGLDTPYVPGWDTHGLPIEHQIVKSKKIKRHEISSLEFRHLCRDYALQFVEKQKQQFYRLGVRGDWDNPYITLKPAFEARQIEVFGEMAARGYIYKGLKPVYWCPVCETALAEAEIEYDAQTSPSIYVKFPVTAGGVLNPPLDSSPISNLQSSLPTSNLSPPTSQSSADAVNNTFCLIWTTTPWTIPANLALAVHPDFSYVLVQNGDEKYLLAEGRLEEVKKETGGENWSIISRYQGRDLQDIVCRHPFLDRDAPVLLTDFVTLEQGTGCVHMAPGHGLDDYYVGQKYGLDVISPIDNRGCFTAEAGRFSGLHYKKGNQAVMDVLQEEGRLMARDELEHQYPHCWRCKKPILFRATDQWFASVEGFRQSALKAIREVDWHPEWGEERIYNMVNERKDWCISRQRVWGVPIPAFYCEDCGEIILTRESIGAVRELFSKEGSDAWYKYEAREILPEGFSCGKCGKNQFRKETDIMDVWFDSGSSHIAVCEDHPDLSWPADLYLEGSDQYRGWFQSSLLTSVAIREQAPYRAVVSHGWVVDGEGKKMSKSLGNVIYPEEIINKYGADILRLWVSSADFTRDVHISPGILQQLAEVYRKIRNTARFLLANLYDFEPERDTVSYGHLREIDRWALARLQVLVNKVTGAFAGYEFHQVFHAVHNYCVVEMSNFYLNVNKDCLYCELPDAVTRRSAQTVMLEILKNITMLIAPVLVFTGDEIWHHVPGDREVSVQLADWPVVNGEYDNQELRDKWETLLQLRDHVARAMENARNEKIIKDTLEAEVTVKAGDNIYQELEPYQDILAELLVVSKCRLEQGLADSLPGFYLAEGVQLAVKVEKSSYHKCPRCWIYNESVKAEPASDGEQEELSEGMVCSRCFGVMKELEKSNNETESNNRAGG